jgi:hypothetical protein
LFALEQWLNKEYGPIFNKIIIKEPVMQKVRYGIGSKIPMPEKSNFRDLEDLGKDLVQNIG